MPTGPQIHVGGGSIINRQAFSTRNRRPRARPLNVDDIHVQRQQGMVFCIIQCFPFITAWIVAFADLSLMIWLNCRDKSKVTVAYHESWNFEAIFLGAEAALAMFTLCAAGGVIASRSKIKLSYCIWICVSLAMITVANFGWVLTEFNRGHTPVYRFWEVEESKSLMSDLKETFKTTKFVPAWMDSMQRNANCCGIVSYEDWDFDFGMESIPDSCCQVYAEGCGFLYFGGDTWNRPTVFVNGCTSIEDSGLNYFALHFLLFLKSVETCFFILALVVWLFCLRKKYPQRVVRPLRPVHFSRRNIPVHSVASAEAVSFSSQGPKPTYLNSHQRNVEYVFEIGDNLKDGTQLMQSRDSDGSSWGPPTRNGIVETI